jgi:hypothetical protein
MAVPSRRIKVPIYRAEVLVLVVSSPGELTAALKRRGFDTAGWDGHGDWEGLTGAAGGVLVCALVADMDDPVLVCAHEAVHLSTLLHNWTGMSGDGSSDESQAYIVGWLASHLHRFWVKATATAE